MFLSCLRRNEAPPAEHSGFSRGEVHLPGVQLVRQPPSLPRSLVLCVQVTRPCSLHTCGGFDPPAPWTAGSGAPLQCRLVAHIGGGAGTPADATGTAAGCSSGHRCGCHFYMPYLAPPHGHPCNATGCCHTAAVTHDCSCHMQCIRMLICHIEA